MAQFTNVKPKSSDFDSDPVTELKQIVSSSEAVFDAKRRLADESATKTRLLLPQAPAPIALKRADRSGVPDNASHLTDKLKSRTDDIKLTALKSEARISLLTQKILQTKQESLLLKSQIDSLKSELAISKPSNEAQLI